MDFPAFDNIVRDRFARLTWDDVTMRLPRRVISVQLTNGATSLWEAERLSGEITRLEG